MIRRATEADIPRMVEMGLRFLRESPYRKHFAENPERMAELGKQLLASDGGILIAEREGRLIGMLGFIIHSHFISGERVCGEVFWWMEPEARGDGVRLLRQVEKEARAAGAVTMQMIAPNERVGDFYARVGYEPIETTYQINL